MKGWFAALTAVLFMVLSLNGPALGQGYYGAYQGQPQAQAYGQGYDQYGQSPQAYQQYGQAPQGYQQYGQPQAYQQGYQPQAYQQGYQPQAGYGGQGGYPGYGQYGNYGQQPTAPAGTSTQQSNYPNPYASPSYASSTARPSLLRSPSDIYWDGSEVYVDEEEAWQAAPQQVQTQRAQPQIQSPQRPAVREARTAPRSSDLQSQKRSRRNVVRRETSRTTPPPPSRSGMQWGKGETSGSASDRSFQWGAQEKPSSQRPTSQAQDIQETAPAKKSLQWGKTERPAQPAPSEAVRSGSPSDSAAQPMVESKSPSKKFNWGSN